MTGLEDCRGTGFRLPGVDRGASLRGQGGLRTGGQGEPRGRGVWELENSRGLWVMEKGSGVEERGWVGPA